MNTSEYTDIPELLNLVTALCEKYGDPIGGGRNRSVWKTGNGNVVKVPRNQFGVTDNYTEASDQGDKLLANCKMILIEDHPIVVMEWIEWYVGDFSDLPEWCGFIDCCQVGYNKNGVLKAFDYGYF